MLLVTFFGKKSDGGKRHFSWTRLHFCAWSLKPSTPPALFWQMNFTKCFPVLYCSSFVHCHALSSLHLRSRLYHVQEIHAYPSPLEERNATKCSFVRKGSSDIWTEFCYHSSQYVGEELPQPPQNISQNMTPTDFTGELGVYFLTDSWSGSLSGSFVPTSQSSSEN